MVVSGTIISLERVVTYDVRTLQWSDSAVGFFSSTLEYLRGVAVSRA